MIEHFAKIRAKRLFVYNNRTNKNETIGTLMQI